MTGEHCPICGGKGFELPTLVEGYKLRECCAGQLSWQWSSVEEYEGLYEVDDKYAVEEQNCGGQKSMMERDEEYRSACLSRANIFLALGYLKDNSITLDVGAGTGAFIGVLRELGFEAFGIDPGPAQVKFARSRGRQVFRGGWQDVPYGYDIITLFDVFEHIVDSRSCLQHLGKCLKPGGKLIIECPEWDSPQHRLEGFKWRHIRPRQHIWIPNRRGIEKMFLEEGFELQAFWRPLDGRIGKACWVVTRS